MRAFEYMHIMPHINTDKVRIRVLWEKVARYPESGENQYLDMTSGSNLVTNSDQCQWNDSMVTTW
jgi:hypothetical protein